MADDLFELEEGFTAMAVDPSKGQILGLLIQTPGIGERINQGGFVGYLIILIGLLGVAMSLWRMKYLKDEGDAINRQLKSSEPSNDNSLGRILSIYKENQGIDPETLELKVDEAILREVPQLEKYHSIIKVFAAVAPLMGLLGTVVGMIVTFQALTLFGTGDPKLMAGGISQALVTTMLGLIVAIPLVFLHSVLTSWSTSLIEILEEQSAGLIAKNAGKS
jgi:biopolymer transport protein ExbB|tara:strand:- start:1393 stop:2052 length:660 start_codon:yes stop_codon:yes gene_type:complete